MLLLVEFETYKIYDFYLIDEILDEFIYDFCDTDEL